MRNLAIYIPSVIECMLLDKKKKSYEFLCSKNETTIFFNDPTNENPPKLSTIKLPIIWNCSFEKF